jgi:obg-like ATPase 1
VEGAVDPLRDVEIINNELRLKDVEFATKFLEGFKKLSQQDKQKRKQLPTVEKVVQMLKDGESIRECTVWKATDVEVINQMQLLTVKPVIYLVNMSERDFLRQRNKYLPVVKEWIQKNGNHIMVPYSAAVEAKLADMDEAERKAFLTAKKTRPMLGRIILAGYKGLDLVHYFTAGEKEVKCWTLRALTKAPQAAGVIHTDFEKGFICAEIMSFESFKEHGSESACRKAGLYRQQGKEYVVQDGDIIFFKCNTGRCCSCGGAVGDCCVGGR